LPEDIDWKPFPAFPPSVRLAVVVGHPSEPGPYTIRVKVPSGVKLMPHRHPEDRVYRLGIGIRVERGVRHEIVARPEARAADLVRIGLSRNAIRQIRHAPRMKGGPPAGKASDGKIEASPEEMDRAALAKEGRAELEEHPLDFSQDAPMPFGKVAIVG